MDKDKKIKREMERDVRIETDIHLFGYIAERRNDQGQKQMERYPLPPHTRTNTPYFILMRICLLETTNILQMSSKVLHPTLYCCTIISFPELKNKGHKVFARHLNTK